MSAVSRRGSRVTRGLFCFTGLTLRSSTDLLKQPGPAVKVSNVLNDLFLLAGVTSTNSTIERVEVTGLWLWTLGFGQHVSTR